ncbi:MAG: PEP-CTERM sorting domain-containing protein [Phycisphaerae bacterium]
MSYPKSSSATRRLLPAVAAAAIVAVSFVGGVRADYTVTPPTSVPTTYTDSTPLTQAPSNLVQGLTVNLWQITPITNLVEFGPGNLEGGPGTSGFPNLQGMANLEALAQNGSISVGSNGVPDSPTGSATYSATPYFSFVNNEINSSHVVAMIEQGTIDATLNGSGNNLATNLISGINMPASTATAPWQDIIFDQSGYVYVSQANSSYTFAVASNDLNDDGTEILLGGNGKVGSGTVVGFENASDSVSTNGVATLVNAYTYPAVTDTVTFTQAGYYPFEIFNAQTWGGAGENVSFAPVGNAPDLTFYTATPEPAAAWLLAAGAAGLVLLRRRRIGRA